MLAANANAVPIARVSSGNLVPLENSTNKYSVNTTVEMIHIKFDSFSKEHEVLCLSCFEFSVFGLIIFG
jgi:hypothetical protein